MAPTKRKRKHRGTQSGAIDRRRRRPRNRQEARAQARRGTDVRRDRPPTWQSSFNRALLMGGVLLLLLVLITGQDLAPSLFLSAFMVGIYTPSGYYLERFLYNRRRAKEQKARLQRQQQRGG
jgi:cytochrome c-type biogenesis protein CcmH/NrfG